MDETFQEETLITYWDGCQHELMVHYGTTSKKPIRVYGYADAIRESPDLYGPSRKCKFSWVEGQNPVFLNAEGAPAPDIVKLLKRRGFLLCKDL